MAITIPRDKMTTSLVKRYKYVQHIEKIIGEGEWNWSASFSPKATDDGWHPSGHCTPPLLDLYHMALPNIGADFTQVPKSRGISPSLYKTFAVGHFWHAYLQELTVRAGLCDESAVERRGALCWEFEPDTLAEPGHHYYLATTQQAASPKKLRPKPYHWATGSGDLAPVSLPGHGDYLIDFKTMKGTDFRLNDPPGWTAHKWECQMNVYMDWFDLEHAIIVGVQKDSPHDMKEWEYHRNQPLIDAIYLKWQIVAECVEQGIEPPEDEDVELPLKGPVKT